MLEPNSQETLVLVFTTRAKKNLQKILAPEGHALKVCTDERYLDVCFPIMSIQVTF